MKKTLSNVFLFVVGVLLSVTLASNLSSKEDVVVLTKNNHIVFSGEVSDRSVAEAQVKLGQLSKDLGENEVIYLVLDTPGGSVTAGNLFIDFAKSLPQRIKPICIFCASMGYHMFQSFDERLVYSSSTLMSHRAALGGIGGQIPGELDTRLKAIKEILNQMDDIASKRVGITREAYQKLIYDELWLDGTSAVRSKHADRVAKIRCSKDIIAATRKENIMTIFGPVDVTFSQCPLINGILGVEFARGTTKFRDENEAIAEVRKKKRKIVLEL